MDDPIKAAREQVAADAMRQACADYAAACRRLREALAKPPHAADGAEAIEEHMRAILLPLDALDAMLAQAKREGMEEAAQWHDERAKAANEWRYWGGPSDGAMQAHQRHHIDSAAGIRAAAIRAAAKETPNG